jgi:DNA-binding CsgD family transcriptional regulator
LNTVNWVVAAQRLLDRDRRPSIVLDGSDRIRLANRAFESLLGGRPLAGSRWPGRGWRAAPAAAASAAKGLREFEISTARGRRLRLEVEVTPVGRGGGGAVLSVVRATPATDLGPPPFEGDLHYEVTDTKDDFGTVLAVWPEARRGAVGHRCYWSFFGRSEPCVGCPAKEDSENPTGPSVITDPSLGQDVMVATARRVGPGARRVVSRRVGPDLLGHALRGRLALLATRAVLSDREREVLEGLVHGLSIDEMAERLHISPRTVKFHQARALEKLGADSRTDLLRVVFG